MFADGPGSAVLEDVWDAGTVVVDVRPEDVDGAVELRPPCLAACRLFWNLRRERDMREQLVREELGGRLTRSARSAESCQAARRAPHAPPWAGRGFGHRPRSKP